MVHPLSDVICEVYEPTIKLPVGGGAFDSVAPIQRGLSGRKTKQGVVAKSTGAPYVIVIGRANSHIPIDVFSLVGAAFGRIGFSFAISPATGQTTLPKTVFGQGGRLQERMNTRFSALIRVTRFNPTLYRVNRAYEARLARGSPSPSEAFSIINETFRHFEATGEFDDAASVARLTVLHNPHAANPLPMEVFGGPHDDQFAVVWSDDTSGQFTLVAQGRHRWEVPD